MTRRQSRSVVATTVTLILATVVACGPPAAADVERAPAPAEAEAFLTRVAGLARTLDFAGLCALGGGNCEKILEVAGRDAVPALPPTLVDQFELPARHYADGSTDVGGRVLVLCGIDGHARPYRTEMLVFFHGSELIAIEPIYWSGSGIATDRITAPQPQPAAAPCMEASPSPA